MRIKSIIFILVTFLVLITGCAKRNSAWKESEVLGLLAQVPVVGNPIDLVVGSTHAFVALDQGGFAALNLSNHQMTWYTNILANDGSNVRIQRIKNISVVPEHNLLFVNEVEGTDGIKIISTADMDSLKLVLAIFGGTQSLRHMEFHAIADPFMGVDVEGVYSISRNVSRSSYNSSTNEWMGSSTLFESPATAQGIDFNKDYCFVAAQQRGLAIYDRNAGELVGQIAFKGEAQRVQVSGNYAYVASRQGGLNVVDISNPAAPVVVSNFDTVGYATSVDVKGNLVVISSGAGGVYLFDVSIPSQPKLLQRLTSCGYVNDARFYANKLVVAGRDEGMLFYSIDR